MKLNCCIQVPFFSDDEETPSTPKADALFVPRENPRSLVIRPMEQWSLRSNAEKTSPLKEASKPVHENGKFFCILHYLEDICCILGIELIDNMPRRNIRTSIRVLVLLVRLIS